MSLVNAPAPNVPYFTPAQVPPTGSALDVVEEGSQKPTPSLFQPIKIRGLTLNNRIFLSPLCQYSAENGRMTPWHMAHLGGIASRGPGLTFIEATAVVPQGRISPEDVGLWSDDQIAPMREVVDFIHSQGGKVAIQLAHAGRKASTVAPWLSFSAVAAKEHGGWADDVWAPSAIPYDENSAVPKELSEGNIQDLVKAFVDAAKRALKAGVDVIEIHNAHGYLLHEFLSPYSNKRKDKYGGSFENRTRFTLEVVDALRKVIPESMPLFLRVSATDWLEEALPNESSWTLEDTVKLAGILAERGVDLLDVSSAGNSPKQKIKQSEPAYQSPFSEAVKNAHGLGTARRLLIGAVGGIKTGEIAQDVLSKGKADVIFVGRQFQKDPGAVWTFAENLGVKIKVANQIGWGFGLSSSGRGGSVGSQKPAKASETN